MKNKILIIVLLFILNKKAFTQTASALNFDGINDYVALANINSVFNISSTHIKAVQFWFKNTSNQGNHVRIFSTGSAGWTTGFWFGFQGGSQNLMIEISDGVGSGCVVTATTATRGDNLWHHATGVFNGSVATLYLDGIKQSTVNISSEGNINSSGAVHIGNSYNNESQSNFRGEIDELRVWDRIPCQVEIMGTMNCELTGSETGLVAYYKFNQGVSSGNNSGIITLNDANTNSNQGTLNSFSLSGSTSNWVSPGGVVSGNICTNTVFPVLQVSSTATILCPGFSSSINVSGANSYMWQPGNISGAGIVVTPTTTTTYSVTGTTTDGCVNSTNFTQSVATLPLLQTSSSPSIFCRGLSSTISVNGANTYTWQPGNISGSSIVITPTVLTTINYTITGTSNSGCLNSTSFTHNVVLCGTSIQSNEDSNNSMIYYPNPMSNILIVENLQNRLMELEIYSTLGSLLFSEKINPGKTEINLSHYSKGVYIINVKGENYFITKKIIKE